MTFFLSWQSESVSMKDRRRNVERAVHLLDVWYGLHTRDAFIQMKPMYMQICVTEKALTEGRGTRVNTGLSGREEGQVVDVISCMLLV